jgi:hypothetical protein
MRLAHPHWSRLVLGAAFSLPLRLGAAESVDPAKFFHEEVAPVLVRNCVECHNATSHKGGLSIETLADALKGGEDGASLVPGKPLDSTLYTKLVPDGPGEKPEMPKKKAPLSPEDAARIRQWIETGAVWPKEVVLKEKAKADQSFWSFQPLANVVPPALPEDAPSAWRENPIDRFVLAKLHEKHLTPNPPADAATFIRRATYDLTGLPPTPEEVAAFVAAAAHDRPSAVAALVDRLLDSPRYGEQWGRHWLDVIRFGESRGYERNQIITNLWPFRDYVIRSFNEDKPFDQFIQEQIAGDILGAGRPDVEIGAAFLVAGPYDDVGNQDPIAAAQIRADEIDEMIRATGEAFLGLTIGCARCHDHKFDPLLARDYYALYSTFAGVVHGERVVATPEETRAHEARLKPLEARKTELTRARDELTARLAEQAKAAEPEAAKTWTRPPASRYGTEETFPPVDARYVRLVVEGNDLDDVKTAGFTLDEFEVWTDDPEPRNAALAANGGHAEGKSREAKDFAGAYTAALVIDGKFGERWHAAGSELVITLARVERIRRVVFSSDRAHSLGAQNHETAFVGDYRIEVSLDGAAWTPVASSADRMPVSLHRKEARLRKLVTAPADATRLAQLAGDLAAVDAEVAKIPPLPVWWVGKATPAPGPFNVFLGGNPQRKGDSVVPASLNVFQGRKSAYQLELSRSEGERRVALARWLTAPENPLTPRVLVNRLWHYHFGTGIVDTPSDFGYMGGRPTHPQLLDWLAQELAANHWQIKKLHRLIMTSQAYQQSGQYRDDAAQIDGDSRLLWRFPPRRLSAEEVRDTLLADAGKLDLTMGGPGFRLYEYQQDNVATYVPLDQQGPETYRRAVYHHNARAARVDILTDFDAPDPSFPEPRRAATTTPLQALTLMNHRFAVTMAQAMAERLPAEAGSDAAAQVRRAFHIAYGREPAADELDGARRLIAAHGLRAFCRALLNSTEVISLD